MFNFYVGLDITLSPRFEDSLSLLQLLLSTFHMHPLFIRNLSFCRISDRFLGVAVGEGGKEKPIVSVVW